MFPSIKTALTCAVVLLALAAAPAYADTASLRFTDAAGKEDPVAGIGRTLTLSGNSSAPKRTYVKFRAPGGAACGPSAESDSGEYLDVEDSSFEGSSFPGWEYNGKEVNGDFAIQHSGSWAEGPGTFMFCMWLADDSEATASPITQNITFRAANGSVSAAVNPATVQPDEKTTVTFSGVSEGPAKVYAKVRTAGGAPCSATSSADSGSEFVYGREVNGTFSFTETLSQEDHGTYLICTWLADSSTDTTPIAGPQPTTFTVAAPPPPCLVPSLAGGTTLAAATSALTGAGCSVGQRRYVASRRFARGTLVRTLTAAGTRLGNNAPVDLLISSGAPCVVPRATRGLRVAGARAKLRAAGCTPGAVRSARSRRKRGTVVRFTRASGTRLSPRSTVGIVVSRGRR